ncbi:MAG: porin family protein [Endomicrobium sp.]|jgi:hypothetical protein|nr:porin family protein [Endomicrobium sp.]
MKKLLALVFMFVFVQVSFAKFFAGGTVGITATKEDSGSVEDTTNGYVFGPQFGYDINDRWGVGLGLYIQHNKTEHESGGYTSEIKSDGWAVAPFARFNAVEYGKFNLYFIGGLAFGGVESKSGSYKSESDLVLLEITPQLQYSLSDSFALIADLNFAKFKYQNISGDNDNDSSEFSLGVNSDEVLNTSSFSIGFLFRF